MRVRGMLLIVLSLVVDACSGGRNMLTTERAQQALNQWAPAGNAHVTGVLEVAQENSAKADVQFSELKYSYHDPMFGGNQVRSYSGAGVAIFSHYNDGRWVLSQIVFSRPGTYGEPLHWDNLNIPVGKGLAAPKERPASANLGGSPSALRCFIGSPVGSLQKPLTGIVTSDEARFILPIDSTGTWKWNVEKVRPGWQSLESNWKMSFPLGAGDSVRFGVAHFAKGDPEQTGDTRESIAAGNVYATREHTVDLGGGRSNSSYTDLHGFQVEPYCSNVAFIFRGKENVATVFAIRPSTIEFIRSKLVSTAEHVDESGFKDRPVAVTYE